MKVHGGCGALQKGDNRKRAESLLGGRKVEDVTYSGLLWRVS